MNATTCALTTQCVQMVDEWAEPEIVSPVEAMTLLVLAGAGMLILAVLGPWERRRK